MQEKRQIRMYNAREAKKWQTNDFEMCNFYGRAFRMPALFKR